MRFGNPPAEICHFSRNRGRETQNISQNVLMKSWLLSLALLSDPGGSFLQSYPFAEKKDNNGPTVSAILHKDRRGSQMK